MGFWSGVWEGVKKFGGAVARVAKTAWDIANGPSAKSTYDDLEKIIDKYDSRRSREVQVIDSPNFLSKSAGNALTEKINEHEDKIEILNNELVYARKFMAIQNEFSRLRNSAELIDRGMANVKIHASSLSTHFQNMRNINGLTEDVNALRGGLKHIMRTFNHNMNVLGANSEPTQLRKIEGVDVELKDGAVSLVAAFDAFDRTRELLSEEIYTLSKIANAHSKDILNLKKHATDLEDDLGRNIVKFIDTKIIPVINNAKKGGLLLQEEIEYLPAAARDENGKIIFEDGKLKIRDSNED
jgi:disulfide oxidoreductase YuzD